ncbi:MAG: lipid II flippase MurJ [Methylococcales bacterium]
MLIVAGVVFVGAVLNTRGKFTISELTPVLLNIFIIVAAILLIISVQV